MQVEEIVRSTTYTLEDVLMAEEKNGYLHYLDLHAFISTKGIDKITSKDLNAMVEKYGTDILCMNGFQEVYGIVSNNESSKVMKNLTWAIVAMTLIMTFCTVIMAWPNPTP